MEPSAATNPTLLNLISAAVAPVVLISAAAILFSGLTSKHSHLADQIRQVTAEYRRSETTDGRRRALRGQLRLFLRRMNSLWLSTGFLAMSILSFIVTIFFVIGSQRIRTIERYGADSIISGLIFLTLSVLMEISEIVLARWTLISEVSEIVADPEAAKQI